MENNNISTETLLRLDDSFNMASLLGKAILATAYTLKHPGEEPPKEETAPDSMFGESGPTFPSDKYEIHLSNQLRQLHALFTPEVKAFLQPSALFEMLLLGAELLGIDPTTLDPGLPNTLDSFDHVLRSSCAWVIAKRVFAIRHPEDTIKIISVSDSFLTDPKSFAFAPFDETDKQFVTEACHAVKLDAISGSETTLDVDKVTESITQLVSTGKIFLPSSEAFRRQNEFAMFASERKLPVGGGVNIIAKITAPDGKSPLKLSMFEMHIEAAVGQLFQENGFKPITVTPEQIYRAFAGLSSGAAVTAKQKEETIKAMDKLITTPATLDFAKQIEKFTRMKRRDEFDYNDSQRRGTLITGVHDRKSSKTYNGKSITDTFTIHELPMFYAYSYAIGQLYTVQAKYLSGETQPDPNAEKKTKPVKMDKGKQNSTIDDTVLFRVLLEYIEFQRSEKEKRDRKYAREKKPAPATFEFYLPFDTVAKKAAIENPTPKIMRNLRDKTYNFLLAQAKMGNVRRCIYYKKGRALHGVKVAL